jgi:glycosyltransferase involved in cell wall biosynthesis
VTHWYGIELMVQAIGLLRDELPGLRALILGGGDAVDSVRELISSLGLEDRVQLPGRFLPYEEALAAVREADAGVVPNLPSQLNDLTLSGKLLDYALLGVPAIVAELEGQAAHFSPDEVTFFTAGDAASLAQAIRSVAANPQEAELKAQRARERASAYSWERQRDTYQHLLDELTGAVPEPAPLTAGVS